MDTITSTLIAFGLTKNEVKVYREIIRQQETNPFAIARATGIPRTTVYEILTSLAFKELIGLQKSEGLNKQQTRIIAKDPSYLRTIIRNRRSDLARMDANIVHILPMLKKDYIQSQGNSDFQFFSGIEGAKKVYLQSCLDDVDLPEYVFNYKIADDVFGRDVVNAVADAENKQKRKFIPKEILPLTDWTRHCISYQYERDPRYIDVTNIRYIDQAGFNLTTKILVKDTRIWTVSVEGEECWGSIMKSKTLAQSLIAVFQCLWQIGTPLTSKVVESWGKNDY